MDLDSIEWKTFLMSDIFDIKSGYSLKKGDMKEGAVPFVGASGVNNGVTNFISNKNSSLDSNLLGVNFNGSVGENFYHPYEAIFSSDVKRLKLKNKKGNKYLYLFLKTIILQQKVKYQYGYKFSAERMNKQYLMLPIDQFGNPDWDFMENYIKQIELELIGNIVNHFEKQLEINKSARGGVIPYKTFKIKNLFKVLNNKRYDNKDLIKSNKGIPYITRTSMNNGLGAVVQPNKEFILSKSNCISLGAENADFFYQSIDFISGNDMYSIYNENINRYIGLFLVNCLRSSIENVGFGYGMGLTGSRLKNRLIKLPVNKENNPDWQYMNDYMMYEEAKQIKAILEHYNKIKHFVNY